VEEEEDDDDIIDIALLLCMVSASPRARHGRVSTQESGTKRAKK